MQSNYLIHYGILGQKWGVRRFENEDGSLTAAGKERYSSDQYRRDRAVYGKSGANRIQKNVDKGDSVSGARSKEASRINSTRARARTAGQVGRTVGSVAGAIGGYYASKAVRQALALKYDVLNDPPLSMAIDLSIASGVSSVSKTLASNGAQSITMILGGYSPDKYR